MYDNIPTSRMVLLSLLSGSEEGGLGNDISYGRLAKTEVRPQPGIIAAFVFGYPETPALTPSALE
jgi:hypothetical protein